MRRSTAAFTLIELLVVIVIIAVLAGVALPIFGSVQLQGKKVQALSNMRQLGTALALYCGQNNGNLPTEGESTPTFHSASLPNSTNDTAWYNALPRLGNFPAVGDFDKAPADFYTKRNLLYVPAAKYPSTKVTGGYPLFAVSFCSKIYNAAVTSAMLQNFSQPAHTVAFQESGVPGETLIYSTQSAYNGQSKSFASRSITRYAGKTIITFLDGHAESLAGSDIVDRATGKGYFPQSKGRVYWTLDPTASPN